MTVYGILAESVCVCVSVVGRWWWCREGVSCITKYKESVYNGVTATMTNFNHNAVNNRL